MACLVVLNTESNSSQGLKKVSKFLQQVFYHKFSKMNMNFNDNKSREGHEYN